MDTNSESGDLSENYELTFYKTNQGFRKQITAFRELITQEEDAKTAIEDIKFHNQVIVGIINNFIQNVAPTPHMSFLLEPIKKLSDIFEHDMGKPLSDKYVHTDKLKSYYNIAHERQSNINDITEELDIKRIEHHKFTKEKTNHINRTQDKLRLARNYLEQEVFHLIVCYNKLTTAISEGATSRILNTNQLFQDLAKKFQMLVTSNKIEETSLKNRKQTLDEQLAQWIGKYDQDIGEREEELQLFIQKYNTALIEFTDLEIMMNKHEIVYNKSVLEKTTEEKRIFDFKLRTLMENRAAKTLQRAWRTHRAQQKRKKRKGGKKKRK